MTGTDTTPPEANPPAALPAAPAGARAGSAEPDPRVLAMARAFDRTRRKVDDLDTQVAQLAADLTRLAGVVTGSRNPAGPAAGAEDGERDAAAGDGAPGAVRSWLLAADPEQAVTDLADLVEWLDRVYLRYPGADLSACWLWHPHVIEELWWLRRAHGDAYDPQDGSWLRVGDWHDRQRPAVAKRVRDAVGKCDLSLHAPNKPHGQAPQVAPLAGHAAAIATAWTTGGTRPEPTAAQIEEGATYFQTFHRGSR